MLRYFFFSSLVIIVIMSFFLFKLNQKTSRPLYGFSYSPSQAEWLDLPPIESFAELLQTLRPASVRLSVHWNRIETEPTQYDFSELDRLMEIAQTEDTKIILAVGQKSPRYPECHIPDFVDLNSPTGEKSLFDFLETIVKRYGEHPALEFWQVENEPFISFEFGECQKFRRDLLDREIAIFRELNPERPIIMTDSGELGWWKEAANKGDIFGSTLYRFVRRPDGALWRYKFLPPVFYRAKAFLRGIKSHRFFVVELQAEPWFEDLHPRDVPSQDQLALINSDTIREHAAYATRTGAERVYFWGAEWWLFMDRQYGDKSLMISAEKFLSSR